MTDSHIAASSIPTLLTPKEAAVLLRISKASLYRLVDSRVVPFHRVGRGLRFADEDIKAYLASSRVESVRR
ncbi:MAG: helix-turn-helix domain-containing protein [Ignavibacteriales bacterium]|nr:helix-turn-helix domain-containing protein [Ignavibacteriales bacterium]